MNFHPDRGIDACQDPYVKFANALGIDPNSKVKLPDLDQSEGNETYANAYFTYCIEPLNVDIAWTDTAEATTWSNYLYVRYPALRKNKRTMLAKIMFVHIVSWRRKCRSRYVGLEIQTTSRMNVQMN